MKEIDENNRLGKTRDLFKKIRDIKGTFHVKIGLIKDRYGRDLTEGGGIKKRWQEYTEELHKKRSSPPAQVGCMRQVLRAGALGRPRGMGWGGRREGGSGWGTHVSPWLIHVNVWQKPLQYYKVISFQLIKINEKKKKIFITQIIMMV